MNEPLPEPGAGGTGPERGAGETARLEAFSDGVFAIAITLLVLDIKVPPLRDTADGAALASALAAQWPNYLDFVTSFVTVLIMWMNHHTMFRQIRRADHTLFLLNGLLLLGITLVPFSTSLLAEYIQNAGAQAAELVYSGIFLGIAVLFNLLWHYAIHSGRLLRPDVDPAFIRAFTRGYNLGLPAYLLAFLLAFVNGSASLVLCALVALFFALPTRPSRP